MERDPLNMREQKRLIKLTPAQRKKERNEKAHFGIHVANIAVMRGLGRGLSGGARAVSRSRNVTANPFKPGNKRLMEYFREAGKKTPSKKSPVKTLNIKAQRNPNYSGNPMPKPGTQGLPKPPPTLGGKLYTKPKMLKNKRKSCM